MITSSKSTLTYLDIFSDLLQPVVPKSIIDPESHQFEGWLAAKCIFCGHVEIVHERHHFLAAEWDVDTLCSLLDPTLNDILHITGRCLK